MTIFLEHPRLLSALHDPSHILTLFLLLNAFSRRCRTPNRPVPFLITPHTSGLSAAPWLISIQRPRQNWCWAVGEMLKTECLHGIRLMYEHDGMWWWERTEWAAGHWVVRRELSVQEGAMWPQGVKKTGASSSLEPCWHFDCLVAFMHYKGVCFNNIFTLSLWYIK